MEVPGGDIEPAVEERMCGPLEWQRVKGKNRDWAQRTEREKSYQVISGDLTSVLLEEGGNTVDQGEKTGTDKHHNNRHFNKD